MTQGFVFGLAVALGGALLLAGGSEMQSRAVFEAGGRWRVFALSPRWWIGLLLLGTAVSSNFVALALAPVTVVQSVSIHVALAVSVAFAHVSGRARVGLAGAGAAGLCAIEIVGFVVLVGGAVADDPGGDPVGDLSAVTAILAALATLGLFAVAAGASRRATQAPRWALGLGLITAPLVFGSITTVFKVLVALVCQDGVSALAAGSGPFLALATVAAGGIIANVLLQRSHHRFAAPVVVAAITIVDPLTAAVMGLACQAGGRPHPLAHHRLAASGGNHLLWGARAHEDPPGGAASCRSACGERRPTRTTATHSTTNSTAHL